ncbi:50S ribosomal protein L15 [Candidatus Falkowbacteria bacterium]|jgi:large subunit ribosomal protein L15|nr:50S ribosomal protein L15 [Candidatus Falkowbacteria bacterium]MBT4433012.1 50S ribosomal protein L15 [Candidatus Falkowbacteria bacterium]
MKLGLHNLQTKKGAIKKKKRVGRGNASGHGTYSTRGLKGQRSRSGGKGGLKRLGLKSLILSTPKKKGFKSARPKNQVVNLSDLNNKFKDGSSINAESLLKAKLIKDAKAPIKVLGTGELKLKKIEINGIKISNTVKEQVEKLGGKVLCSKK